MKKISLFALLLLSITSYSQKKPILVFDLLNKTIDSISIADYDTTTQQENTIFNLGSFDTKTEVLSSIPPTSNIYPNSQFTYKKLASSEFDLTLYPIRTTVKIFQKYKQSIGGLCSGSLISRKHVLTAAHCISIIKTNRLRVFDSLFVSPIFDNGKFSSVFNSSTVTKVYFFRDWNIAGEDIAILELMEPIGESTGWLSIGFNTSNNSLKKGVFYKFSYPSVTNLAIDSAIYNGDSLYYNYGVVDRVNDNLIQIYHTSGIEGESGSSIIKVVNENEYTSYGVLSFSLHLGHSRINRWKYNGLKAVIDNELYIPEKPDISQLVLYPNPVENVLHFKNLDEMSILQIKLTDNLGRSYPSEKLISSSKWMDVSYLSNGIYYLSIITNQSIITRKFIKTSSISY